MSTSRLQGSIKSSQARLTQEPKRAANSPADKHVARHTQAAPAKHRPGSHANADIAQRSECGQEAERGGVARRRRGIQGRQEVSTRTPSQQYPLSQTHREQCAAVDHGWRMHLASIAASSCLPSLSVVGLKRRLTASAMGGI
jgi:hypothetical protein